MDEWTETLLTDIKAMQQLERNLNELENVQQWQKVTLSTVRKQHDVISTELTKVDDHVKQQLAFQNKQNGDECWSETKAKEMHREASHLQWKTDDVDKRVHQLIDS